ncbi:MAG: gluconokinase [Bacteroidetes bacterium]|nr:gluconokinase [Fibrella sp.]
MTCFVGVDIGTTNIKLLAMNPETDEIVAHVSDSLTTLSPQPDWAEQDPEAIWQVFRQLTADLVIQLDAQRITIDRVSFGTAMHSLLAVDAAGNPLTNAVLWSDNRAEAEATSLRTGQAALGKSIYAHTGTPIHPMIPLCKLAWFRETDPRLLYRAAKWISIKEYIWWKLTGHYHIDYSIATATGLFDEAAKTWYGPALDFAGVRAEQLSTPQPTTFSVVYQPQPNDSGAVKFPADVAMHIGASDGCLANLGAGAIGPGITTITIGTSGAIRRTVDRPLRDPAGRLFCYYLDASHYVVGGPTNNGGNVLEWLAEHLTQQTPDAVLAEAETVPPGADGLIFLPYLLGERAPLWDANVRGAYLNVGWQHTRAHFVRAALEGVLLNLWMTERLLTDACGPTTVIHANGGFARSRFWVQMMADVFGVPVRLNDSNESSAMGAVLLAEKAASNPPVTLDDLTRRVGFGDTFTPDITTHLLYQAVFERFTKAADALQ